MAEERTATGPLPRASPVLEPRLEQLRSALDQLKVPAKDQIDIIRMLHKSGYLHAKLIVE